MTPNSSPLSASIHTRMYTTSYKELELMQIKGPISGRIRESRLRIADRSPSGMSRNSRVGRTAMAPAPPAHNSQTKAWVPTGEQSRAPVTDLTEASRWLHNTMNLPLPSANKKDVRLVPTGNKQAVAHQRRVYRPGSVRNAARHRRQQARRAVPPLDGS
jgi:hypothetical protein